MISGPWKQDETSTTATGVPRSTAGDRRHRREPGTGPDPGFVSLVGAGPGDPALLTVQALDRLRAADLVLYDALVAPEILALATRAQCFCVGKRAGRPIGASDTIIRILAPRRPPRAPRGPAEGRRPLRARAGRRGSPGPAERGNPVRGGAGADDGDHRPALAGIPLTHRGVASAFAVVSGHHESSFRPVLSALAPGSLTIVVLMGLARRAEVADCLLDRGWPADTAAAIVCATSPRTRTWIGRWDNWGRPRTRAADTPGTIVIGKVVDLQALLDETKPDAAEAVERKGWNSR